MHDVKRRTGRTFRTILEALSAASAGEKVIVRVFSDEYARELLPTAAKIADGYYSKISVERREIAFDGGGLVRFISRRHFGPEGFTVHLADHYTRR